jgi:hypothetical protein
MTNKVIGIRSGNQILPYSGATKLTKQIQVTNASDIVLSGSGISGSGIIGAVIQAYADSLGNWRLRFNVYLNCTSAGARTSAVITFASTYAVTFSAITNFAQSIAAFVGTTATPCTGITNTNAATITVYHASSDESFYAVSGDVALASEPSWAAANMEGTVNASIYIPFGQTGMPGEVITATTGDISVTDTVLMNAASLTLTPGKWQAFGKIYFEKQSGSPITICSASISDTSVTNNQKSYNVNRDTGGDNTVMAHPVVFTVTTNTPIYLVGQAYFPDGTTETQGTATDFYAVRLAP